MCRTSESGTKARLSFSGGPHAPVNMVDSMESTVSGSKEVMEVSKNLFIYLFIILPLRQN